MLLIMATEEGSKICNSNSKPLYLFIILYGASFIIFMILSLRDFIRDKRETAIKKDDPISEPRLSQISQQLERVSFNRKSGNMDDQRENLLSKDNSPSGLESSRKNSSKESKNNKKIKKTESIEGGLQSRNSKEFDITGSLENDQD